MKNIKLTTQLNLIFTVVTLLTSLVFIIALNRVFSDLRTKQNEQQIDSYYQEVAINYNVILRPDYDENPTFDNTYNGYIIVQNDSIVASHNIDVLDGHYTINQVVNKFPFFFDFKGSEKIGGITYYFRTMHVPNNTLVIVFTGNDYLKIIGNSFNFYTQISFISLVLLGNIIILFWSKITVERVKRLSGEVELLTANSYRKPIAIDGADEITELAKTIEKMRQQIEKSEKIKQEMLQNLSHDFKTPIAVIQSYAEAISDGITGPEEAHIIIKQAELLNQKVKQLLELNKLEYLRTQQEYENVVVKDLIQNIVNNQKFRRNLDFQLKLDDSTYFGIKDNFYTAFNNILDNAIRYAKTKVVIELSNKKLTFFNDGEPIPDKFIEQSFKPYEKGQKGQFGLGMSIVQRTCEHFNLKLSVKNVDQGVRFTIEPIE
jgi:two-component system sensor histidine kinase CssS